MNHGGLVQMIFQIAKCAIFTKKNLSPDLICKNLGNLLSILSLNASTIWVRIPLGVKVKGASPVIPRPGKTQVSKQAPKAKAKAKAKAQNDKMKDWHVFPGGWLVLNVGVVGEDELDEFWCFCLMEHGNQSYSTYL